MMRFSFAWILIGVVFAAFCQPASVTAQDELAAKVIQIFEGNCVGCHGVAGTSGLNVLDRAILTGDRGKDTTPFITPNNPSESKVFTQISGDMMPPGDPLSNEDKETIRSWIKAGALFPKASRDARPFVSEQMILSAILNDIRASKSNTDKAYLRYFSIAHLHNNKHILNKQLRITRAALSKTINSLSREGSIVVPRIVDGSHDTVLAINIQDVGWDDAEDYVWGDVLQAYPYGVIPKVVSDPTAYNTYQSIIETIGKLFLDKVTHIRADWFVVAATRPPLYHRLADIPDTLQELERQQGLSMADNFMRKQLVRGAVLKSGVSSQNRLVDRHYGRGGAFWISYDFGLNSGLSNVARFPLGPRSFKGNKFIEHGFQEDGSEVIWERRNGFHGYMIANSEGKRIDRAPVQIVWNKNVLKGGSNPEVINGVSCMQCHENGLISFTDILKTGHALEDPDAAVFLSEIVPVPETMEKKYVRPDSRRYMANLMQAVGGFLLPGDFQTDENGESRLSDPVAQVVHQYESPLTVDAAACELGLEKVERLKYANLRRMGLGVYEHDNGVLQRTFWAPPLVQSIEKATTVVSIFEDVVNRMDLGSPIK